jgi:hypothetical protein
VTGPDDAVLVGIDGDLHPVTQIEFGEDVSDVALYGGLAEIEPRGDLRTGWFAAWLTGLPVLRLVRRNVLLGGAIMGASILVGLALH